MTTVQQIEKFEELISKVQNVANAIPPANAVPDVESTDNGKVLKATYSGGEGSYDWEDESYPKPTSATNGQVLTADGAGGASWQDSQGGGSDLPEITSGDSGKVLTAQYDDKSGSGYTIWSEVYGATITRLRLDKSDFSYDDKSGVYVKNIADYFIPYQNVINVRSCDGLYTYKNISTYNMNSNDGNCYTIYFDSTEYTNLESYVEIIYFTM